MERNVIMAGFGGQGIMVMGQILAQGAMLEGNNVLWMPSYGPESRGGFANCIVIISNEEIGSPVVATPQVAIFMNRPSLDKFETAVEKDGVIIVNSSLVDKKVERTDVKNYYVPLNDIAEKIGSQKIINIVALGAYLELTKAVSIATIKKALETKLSGKKDMLAMNFEALDKGAEYIRQA